MKKNISALIPARSGSQRVSNKNIRELQDVPLIAYTIAQAMASQIFSNVFVSTNCENTAQIAIKCGVEVIERPDEFAQATSPDIDWVLHAIQELEKQNQEFDAFSILRPTSPFRRPKTIQEAWHFFQKQQGVDSLRAIEKVRQHPGKMWVIRNQRLLPILPFGDPPWHSSQYPSLPEIYVQNASLEIAWKRVPLETGTIAGSTVVPWISEELDGFDINDIDDWERAEKLLSNSPSLIPDSVMMYLNKLLK